MKNIARKLLCTSFLFASAVQASPIAVGLSQESTNGFYDFLLATPDTNGNWVTINNIKNKPTEINFLMLGNANCYNATCIITGSLASDKIDNDLHGFLLTSKDSGKSWQYIEEVNGFPGNSLNKIQSSTYSAKCFDKKCLAFAYDINKDFKQFLLTSYDHGSTWSTKEMNILNMPANATYSGMTDLSCKNSTCLSLGYYTLDNNSNKKMMVLVSQDAGETWTAKTNLPALPAPSNTVRYLIQFVGTNYVLYQQTFTQDQKNIFLSKDNGDSWTKTNVVLPKDLVNMWPSQYSCTEDSCLMYGFGVRSNNPKDVKIFPFVLASSNNGSDWNYISNIPTISGELSGSSLSLSCTLTGCVISGNSKSNNSKPFILTLKKSNNSWTVHKYQSTIIDFNKFYLRDVSCDDRNCTIVGNASFQQGIVLTSGNDGTEWQKVSQIEGLPADTDFLLMSDANNTSQAISHETLKTMIRNSRFLRK